MLLIAYEMQVGQTRLRLLCCHRRPLNLRCPVLLIHLSDAYVLLSRSAGGPFFFIYYVLCVCR